jgi:hypothetical protein
MHIEVNLSALKETRWYESAVRIVFGGLITVTAGIIAKRFGPSVGGLFLAFPAILPASATLIEKHTREERQKAGLVGTVRGREVASLDARGAAMGSIGLASFALVVRQFLDNHAAWLVLPAATIVWFLVSAAIWRLRKMI